KTKLNVAIGAMLGLLLGIGVALLLERLNRRVRGLDELGQIYGFPVLAAVPDADGLRANGRRTRVTGHETHAFDMLRARLRFYGVDGARSLLVTSCGPQEGSSTAAWNLAR